MPSVPVRYMSKVLLRHEFFAEDYLDFSSVTGMLSIFLTLFTVWLFLTSAFALICLLSLGA